MKRYIRALGVDDSYFVPHEPGSTSLIGVLMRAPNYFEGMLIRKIQVDGLDSTEAILDMLSSKYGRQVRVLFTQGITFGGFNIVDIRRIWEETNVPIIVVSRKEPDMGKIENALKKHFEDWERRIGLIKEYPITKIKNGEFELFVQFVGIDKDEVQNTVQQFTVRGAIPEPLRVAHLIASALYFGESKGKP